MFFFFLKHVYLTALKKFMSEKLNIISLHEHRNENKHKYLFNGVYLGKIHFERHQKTVLLLKHVLLTSINNLILKKNNVLLL